MNDFEELEERKAQAVQKELLGLPVTYGSHEGGLTPNMAQVNGYSIVWHKYSYGATEPDEVEIRLLDGDCVRIAISELRATVETTHLPDSVSFTWHIDDVKALDDSLTDDEAREILQAFEHHHESSQESMWADLEYHIGEYKREREL